jgi:hypothetical protein
MSFGFFQFNCGNSQHRVDNIAFPAAMQVDYVRIYQKNNF